jgi:diacylglycerol kinase family enzyme
LICNPRAGGKWTELARILDSEEGKQVRRIVTDSVDDIAPAIAGLGNEAKLLCIYGGDGTVQRILDHLSPTDHRAINLAFVGGGTMNVTSHWCGFRRSPSENFREVVRSYLGGRLLFREISLLEVAQADARYRGFTFGMGPIVRLLDDYERGRKGKLAALATAGRGIAAALTGFPTFHARLLERMQARITVDGKELGYQRFSALFANVTGQINPGVIPFVDRPTRDTFHYVAYAVSAREFTLSVPGLMRGWLPLDPMSLVRPGRVLRELADPRPVKASVPTDPRYVNANARHLEIVTDEPLFTIDGEIMHSAGPRISVSMGAQVRLAVSSRTTLRRAAVQAARRYLVRD